MAGLIYRQVTYTLPGGGCLKDLDLEIDDGEFVVICGPKDCGGTELIRMALGRLNPEQGEVYINGTRVSRIPRRLREVSLINERPAFGTPRSQITGLLRGRHLHASEIASRIQSAAKKARAEDLMDMRWSRMDQEQQLAAGMARAVAIQAKAALLLEPFAWADGRAKARMRAQLLSYRDSLHMAFVMSTVSCRSAMALSTRTVILDRGCVKQTDHPQSIYDFPADRFVAEYVGEQRINLIPARLVQAGSEVHAVFGENRITLPGGKVARLTDPGRIGGEVILGVRPENLHYEQAFISLSPGTAIEAVIGTVELMGSVTWLHVSLPGVDIPVTAKVDPRCLVRPGDTLPLAIDANRIHLFDPDTGRSLLSRN